MISLLLTNAWDRSQRQKRGGGLDTLSSDALEPNERYSAFLAELSDLLAKRPPPQVLARLEAGEEIAFDSRPVPLRFLLALREDFLPDLQQLRDRGVPGMRRRQLRLEPMRAAAAAVREVVKRACARSTARRRGSIAGILFP